MDLSLTDSEGKFRDELRVWLKANQPTKMVKTVDNAAEHYEYLIAWQRQLYEGGWAGIQV